MKKRILLISIMLTFALGINAQSPTAIVSIPKIYVPGDTIPSTSTPLTNSEFGFEIWLVNTDSVQFAYNAGQYGVKIDSSIVNGGTLTAEIIFSGLTASGKQPSAPEVRTAPDRIRLGANKFGDGGPFILAGDSINVATIKVSNTVPWESKECDYFDDLVLRSFNPDAVAVFAYTGSDNQGNTGKAIILDITRVTYKNCQHNKHKMHDKK